MLELSPELTVPQEAALNELVDLVREGGALLLTGAGLSTESGIPDYRGPTGRARPSTPMTYQTFTGDPLARRRYWARSHLGWRLMAAARPNDGHRAVTALQQQGHLTGVITQNVDGLHTEAGTEDVVELHGALRRVVCLDCGDLTSRASLDRRLTEANRDWHATVLGVHPDGDVDLADDELEGFTPVDCLVCGGTLKPDVVYFGETVPRDRVDRCFALLASASSLVVLGSSLTVMSGYRFVLAARKTGVPVAIVNAGETRGDAQADVRLDAPLGLVLPELARRTA